MRRLADRLMPRSIRARLALAMAIALGLVFVVVQFGLGAVLDWRARVHMEEALHEQARAIVAEIDRGGIHSAAGSAREAARFIGDARMVVTVQGEVIYWNEPVADLEARAVERRGDVEVLLERPDPAATESDWLFAGLVALGVGGAGVVIWVISGRVTRRLRRSVSELADSAEAVTEGRLDVRVSEGEDELGRLAAAFNRMTSQLAAADARQREFLADVAHELRTPVTAIEGFATALADGTARSAADRAESAEFIRSEAARLRHLVRDLQQLTWLDLDPPTRLEEVDLAAAARLTAGRLAAEARARGVELSGPQGSAPAVADRDHVETILSNLVRNALAATPAGGSVSLEAVGAPGESGIAVRDTGRGIPAEHLPHIFDRLYRVQSARDRDAGGSGLGLSIVRRLATLLGGRVSVESEPGDGSTFTLWLPSSSVAAPPRAGVGSGPV